MQYLKKDLLLVGILLIIIVLGFVALYYAEVHYGFLTSLGEQILI